MRGPLAQLVRASGLHPEGHRFEPGRAHKRLGPEAKASGPNVYLLALLCARVIFLLLQLPPGCLEFLVHVYGERMLSAERFRAVFENRLVLIDGYVEVPF